MSANEYFLLSVQYFALGWLHLALKATIKAMAGHSSQGRQFISLWMSRSGTNAGSGKINKAQYYLLWLGLCTLDLFVTAVWPILRFLWKVAGRAWSLSSLGRKSKRETSREEKLNEANNEDFDSITGVLARVVVPEGLSAEGYLKLGKQYKQNGWIAQSHEALNRAQQIAPTSAIGEAASQYLRTKVPRKVPLEAEIANIEGHQLMARGDISKCKAIFERLMTEYPDFEWPYLNLACAYYKDGQPGQAKYLLRKLLSINPNHVEAWELLSRVHVAEFEIMEAQEAINRAKEIYGEADEHQFKTVVDCLAAL